MNRYGVAGREHRVVVHRVVVPVASLAFVRARARFVRLLRAPDLRLSRSETTGIVVSMRTRARARDMHAAEERRGEERRIRALRPAARSMAHRDTPLSLSLSVCRAVIVRQSASCVHACTRERGRMPSRRITPRVAQPNCPLGVRRPPAANKYLDQLCSRAPGDTSRG